MKAILSSRPASYSQLLKRSFMLYRASFSYVYLLALFFSFSIFIPRLLSDLLNKDIFTVIPAFSLHRLWLIAISLLSMAFAVSIFWHMHCVIRRIHEPFIQDLTEGLKKSITVFLAACIQSLYIIAITFVVFNTQVFFSKIYLQGTAFIWAHLIFLLMLAECVIVFYLFPLMWFFPPLIAIENKGALAALKKSILLMWNHWWRVVSLQITPWLAYAILLVFIRFIFHINIHIYSMTEPASRHIMATFLNLVIFAFFVPWPMALTVAQLKDLEIRRKIAIHSE